MRDLNDILEISPEPYDVCIIGSGPAGIVLSAELADTDLRICILESGGLVKNTYNDKLRRVNSRGINIKEYSRERIVGGASTVWSGLSAPLDEVDMSERKFLKVPGWPITIDDLKPYWKLAAERYRFPAKNIFDKFQELRNQSTIKIRWNNISEKIFIAPSSPQRFAKEFPAALDRAGVDFFYNATVLRLEGEVDREHKIAKRVVIISSNKKRHIVNARFFILAAGGIENARLLLSSNDLCKNGLGNENDQVGRYFMNHPKNNYGVIRLKKSIQDDPYFFGCLKEGYAGFAGLRLNNNIQKEGNLLNSYLRFEPIFQWSRSPGVEGLVYLVKQAEGFLNIWKKSKSGQIIPIRDYSETGDDIFLQTEGIVFIRIIKACLAILFHLPSVINYVYYRLTRNKPEIWKIGIRNFMEMEPDPENRIILSKEKDINGQYVPEVILEPKELDKNSLIELHKTVAKELELNGIGKLESNLRQESIWPVNQDASHHLGTTRMGDDPSTSVVNKNLCLHTVDNVYCAGGSVFPTSGCANPTFTICALSIRLAEHLKKKLTSR